MERMCVFYIFFFFSSRRRHTRSTRDWSSDVCSSDLVQLAGDASAFQRNGKPGSFIALLLELAGLRPQRDRQVAVALHASPDQPCGGQENPAGQLVAKLLALE